MNIVKKFNESVAKSKTMSAPERKVSEIVSKIIFKKSLFPLTLTALIWVYGVIRDLNIIITLACTLIMAIASYIYIKKQVNKYYNFKPYVGILLKYSKIGRKKYMAILKQGKVIITLEIHHGGEDLIKIKQNQLIKISYNEDMKIGVVLN